MEIIQNFKKEFEYVDAIGVYNLIDQSYHYKDDQFVDLSFLDVMQVNDCFASSSFLYMQFEEYWIFIRKHDDLLLISQIRGEENVNRVMLELKALELIRQF